MTASRSKEDGKDIELRTIVLSSGNKNTLSFKMRLKNPITKTVKTITALIDCGSMITIINKALVDRKQMPTDAVRHWERFKLINADGTENSEGRVERSIQTNFFIKDEQGNDLEFRDRFLVAKIQVDVILGIDWLQRYNPRINWMKGEVEFDEENEKDYWQDVSEEPRGIRGIVKNLCLAATESRRRPDGRTHCAGDRPGEVGTTRSRNGGGPRDDLRRGVAVTMSKSQELEIAASKGAVMRTFEEMVPEHLREFKAVFLSGKSTRKGLPESRPFDHAITLKPGFEPRRFKHYRLNPEETKLMNEFVNTNLTNGFIVPSKSPMASPFFFVGKKEDGALRPCQDYRYLNEWTVKNAHPLPLVSELLDAIGDASIFTKLDVRWGYNNVLIRPEDRWKAAFSCARGLFEPTVLFFGLTNAPPTFQAMMEYIFDDYIREGWLRIFLDDPLIMSTDMATHKDRELKVIKRFAENDLFLKTEKCMFGQSTVPYLGFIISHGKVEMDPVKLDGITKWEPPISVKGVKSFLGFGNFYRKFIDHYSDKARPLNALTRKGLKFHWGTKEQEAFEALKKAFKEEVALAVPKPRAPYFLATDASRDGTGGILMQRDVEGRLRPISFISSTLNAAERNYDIYDRELLALVKALEEWRHYLEGSPHKVTAWIDHQNLTRFRSGNKLNRRQARWQLFLSRFDLKLEHIAGKEMIGPDALSRVKELDVSRDNEDEILLPKRMFARVTAARDYAQTINAAMEDEEKTDPYLTKVWKGLRGGQRNLPAYFTLDGDGLLRYKDRLFIPAGTLRRTLMREKHDHPTAGHPGRFATMAALLEYWWPSMSVYIKNYIAGCGCQQHKINTHPSRPPLDPIESKSTRPFAQISVDLITDLPNEGGHDSIMVVVDHGLSKGLISTPCNKTITAEGCAQIFFDKVFVRYGMYDSIISDRGPQFASRFAKEMARLLGYQIKLSTAYRPQSDGQTERYNQTIETYLRIYCHNNPEDWERHITLAEFAHNNRTHSSTKRAPFEITLGYSPKALPETRAASTVEEVETRLNKMMMMRDEALGAHELARQVMRERETRGFKGFKVGDQVWLEGTNLKIAYPTRKIAPRREGPFKVIEKVSRLAYKLQLPTRWKIHNTFHAHYLSPYTETEEYGQMFPENPPDLVGGEEEYELEAILKHKGNTKPRRRFFVLWKGWPTSENSWMTTEELANAPEMLQEYLTKKGLSW